MNCVGCICAVHTNLLLEQSLQTVDTKMPLPATQTPEINSPPNLPNSTPIINELGSAKDHPSTHIGSTTTTRINLVTVRSPLRKRCQHLRRAPTNASILLGHVLFLTPRTRQVRRKTPGTSVAMGHRPETLCLTMPQHTQNGSGRLGLLPAILVPGPLPQM